MSRDRDDYLWDKGGERDALVESLERRLTPVRHDGTEPDWDRLLEVDEESHVESLPAATASPWWRRRLQRLRAALPPRSGLAVVAGGWQRWSRVSDRMLPVAVVTALIVLTVALWVPRRQAPPSSWQAEVVAGAPQLGRSDLATRQELRAGDALVTGAGDRVRLRLAHVGEIEVGPRSRLRLVSSAADRQLLALERGSIAAAITSRPQLFEVATPLGRAVDLGCYFTLEVLPDGRERLRVEAGWVALRRGDREAFVPGGAAVVSPPGELGVPVYLDARELRRAVDRWAALPPSRERDAALDEALALARPDDALTLWHLLSAARGEERARVFDRMAELRPPPPTVTREGVLAGDAAMRDRWWQSLGLGSAHWWRGWRVAYPAKGTR